MNNNGSEDESSLALVPELHQRQSGSIMGEYNMDVRLTDSNKVVTNTVDSNMTDTNVTDSTKAGPSMAYSMVDFNTVDSDMSDEDVSLSEWKKKGILRRRGKESKMKKKLTLKRLKCRQCGKKFNNPKNLQRHEECTHETTPVKCIICSEIFGKEFHMKKHMRLNTNIKIFS